MSCKERIRQDLARDGFTILEDIAPSTDQQLLEIAQAIGSIDTGIDIELIGPLVMELSYDPHKIHHNQRPAYYTSEFFPIHTDLSYVRNPPRFILMQCVQPAGEGEGLTLLSDCSIAFANLPERFKNILSQERFCFSYPPNCPVGETEDLAVYQRMENKEIWRFRLDSMTYDDEFSEAVRAFHGSLNAITIKILLKRGDLLIVDNHRMVHGRTAFQAKDCKSGGRHMRRVYAQDIQENSMFKALEYLLPLELLTNLPNVDCTLRQRVSRLVRKTLSFSKNLANHIGAIWYFIHHSNVSLLL